MLMKEFIRILPFAIMSILARILEEILISYDMSNSTSRRLGILSFVIMFIIYICRIKYIDSHSSKNLTDKEKENG